MTKMLVSTVMTASPHTIGAEQSLATAQKMMRENTIRHLPVRKDGKVIGILSERDIDFALRVEKCAATELRVEDACTGDIYSTTPDTSVKEIAAKMAQDRLGCAIVEQDGKLLGIFTTVDACRLLAQVQA